MSWLYVIFLHFATGPKLIKNLAGLIVGAINKKSE